MTEQGDSDKAAGRRQSRMTMTRMEDDDRAGRTMIKEEDDDRAGRTMIKEEDDDRAGGR